MEQSDQKRVRRDQIDEDTGQKQPDAECEQESVEELVGDERSRP
jgi:hypothetical protein